MTLRISRERIRALPAGVAAAEWQLVSPKLIEQFERAAAESAWPIYVFGGTGRGKTAAAACLYSTWPGKARWSTVDNVVRDVIRCRTNGRGFVEIARGDQVFELWETDITRKFADADLCVLDDIGTRQMTDAQREIVQGLLDSRTGKPTIVTGNLSIAELADVADARIASRLSSGIVCHVNGPDQRAVKTKPVEV